MFISTYEKTLLNKKIATLNEELELIKGQISALISSQNKLFELVLAKPAKPKKVLTPEQKAKQREYMKKYTERKREEKKAKLAQAVA